MKYIAFKVNNMAITRASSGDKSSPISGSVNYFGVEFEFDEEFSALAGAKTVEFFKKRNTVRRELIDGKCLIPNEMLKDKDSFDMRVINGNSVATPWVSVAISESGEIMPEEPTEEAPETMEYVKTQSGDAAIPFLRKGEDGMEYSQDGKEWEKGINGVPDVPSKKKDEVYVRKNGDWVPVKELLDKLENLGDSGDSNVIESIMVNGTELAVENKSVNINLSEYAKTEDIEAADYATKSDLNNLKTLQGEASQLEALGSDETDPAAIVAKVNEIISALSGRGITTT